MPDLLGQSSLFCGKAASSRMNTLQKTDGSAVSDLLGLRPFVKEGWLRGQTSDNHTPHPCRYPSRGGGCKKEGRGIKFLRGGGGKNLSLDRLQ